MPAMKMNRRQDSPALASEPASRVERAERPAPSCSLPAARMQPKQTAMPEAAQPSGTARDSCGNTEATAAKNAATTLAVSTTASAKDERQGERCARRSTISGLAKAAPRIAISATRPVVCGSWKRSSSATRAITDFSTT